MTLVTTHTKKKVDWHSLAIVVFVISIAIATVVGACNIDDDKHSDVSSNPPIAITPTAQAEKPLTLELNMPNLSDIQLKYLHEVKVLPRCPLCFGVDKPPIGFTDNQAAAFAALCYTESNLMPYDEYGNHKWSHAEDGTPIAVGVCQLAFSLITEETRDSDEHNIYVGALYFKELLDRHDGDIMAAVRDYKGVVTDDVQWQANSIVTVLRIGG